MYKLHAGQHQQHHDERVAERAQQLQRPVRRLLARGLVQTVTLQACADLLGVESAGVAVQRIEQCGGVAKRVGDGRRDRDIAAGGACSSGASGQRVDGGRGVQREAWCGRRRTVAVRKAADGHLRQRGSPVRAAQPSPARRAQERGRLAPFAARSFGGFRRVIRRRP